MTIRPKHLMTCAVILYSSAIASAQPVYETCKALNETTIADSLQLNVNTFDTDQQKGWRSIASKGCTVEAANLISSYRTRKEESYRLAFHEAQLRLRIGELDLAKPLLLKSIRPELPNDYPFLWNYFVLGYWAYATQDQGLLTLTRDRVCNASENHGNKMNCEVLKSLSNKIDQNYKDIFPEVQ